MRIISTKGTRMSTRLAGRVERYHTWPTLQRQTDGEHTWQVMRIYVQLFASPPSYVWEYIMWHDVPEMMIGDIPFNGEEGDSIEWNEYATAKRTIEAYAAEQMGIPQYLHLTKEEHDKVKLCDLMDCYEFGAEEEIMGNRYGSLICENVKSPIMELARNLCVTTLVQRHLERIRPNE